jgi:hypothetical protein
LRRIELDVMAGRLAPLDFLVAKELSNYPSANEGRCYAGQKRIGKAVGACDRTARSSLKRLRDREFIFRKRGGPGRTASWTFCVNGKPIFGGVAFLPTSIPPVEKSTNSAQERKHAAGLDRKDVSAKPSEQDNPIEHNPPLTPTAGACGQTVGLANEASEEVVHHGEIVSGMISFQQFWLAAGRQGHEGFARGEWRKLSTSDKAAISDRLQRDGRLALRGLWVGTWLRDRVWEEPVPIQEKPEFVCRSRVYDAAPGSELWRAERERLRTSGDPLARDCIKLMDEFAAKGKGWSVRC